VTDIVANGATLTLTPTAGASGVALITVTAQDDGGIANGGDDSFEQTFTVTINEVNDIPSFDATGNFTVDEDSGPKEVLVKNISAGVNEAGQVVSMRAVSSNPSIIPNPSMSPVEGGQSAMIFTPATNASGTVTITLTAQDNGGTANGGLDSFERTFIINVEAVADAPNLTVANVTANEDTVIPLNITSSLNDNDGSETLSVTIDGIPTGSSLSAGILIQRSLLATATLTQAELAGLTITPPANFNDVMSLTVTATATEASNDDAKSTVANLTVNLLPVNDPPIVVNDIATTEQEVTLTLDASVLLSNDTDIDGDALSIFSVQDAVNGVASLSGTTITFIPNPGFVGAASFDYTISDNNGFLATGRVNITVTTAICGNGISQSIEECDDGNTDSGDGCNSVCLLEFCGDGSVNNQESEQCDDRNNLDGDGCNSVCIVEFCGDGIVNNVNETCDDNNTNSGDGCNNVCIEEFCGDGIVNNEDSEECDDGNESELDGCTTQCISAVVCNATAFPDAPLNNGLFAVDPATGHCYIGATQTTDWFSAENICEQNGGTLAVPDSAAENAFILTVRPSAAEMWIGINDINSEAGNNGALFQKVTGGLISFVNFHVNQPSDTNGTEDCVHYDFGNPDWNDFPCGSTVDIAHFACEIPPNVNVLDNGSFETGDYTGWTLVEDNPVSPFNGGYGLATAGTTFIDSQTFFDFADSVQVSTACLGNTGPLTISATDGNIAGFHLQTNSQDHHMFQEVVIPFGTPNFSWDMAYRNSGSFEVNTQFIALHVKNPTTGAILATPFKTNSGSPLSVTTMTNFSVDLSAFSGQLVRLELNFQVQNTCMDVMFDNFILN
jgi:cysteine-rich repeat protein